MSKSEKITKYTSHFQVLYILHNDELQITGVPPWSASSSLRLTSVPYAVLIGRICVCRSRAHSELDFRRRVVVYLE